MLVDDPASQSAAKKAWPTASICGCKNRFDRTPPILRDGGHRALKTRVNPL
jgi:hypothetical protein